MDASDVESVESMELEQQEPFASTRPAHSRGYSWAKAAAAAVLAFAGVALVVALTSDKTSTKTVAMTSVDKVPFTQLHASSIRYMTDTCRKDLKRLEEEAQAKGKRHEAFSHDLTCDKGMACRVSVHYHGQEQAEEFAKCFPTNCKPKNIKRELGEKIKHFTGGSVSHFKCDQEEEEEEEKDKEEEEEEEEENE